MLQASAADKLEEKSDKRTGAAHGRYITSINEKRHQTKEQVLWTHSKKRRCATGCVVGQDQRNSSKRKTTARVDGRREGMDGDRNDWRSNEDVSRSGDMAACDLQPPRRRWNLI